MQGSLDGVDIEGAGGTPVQFSMLGAYGHGDSPGVYKQVQFIRPQFIANSAVSVSCRAMYDYNLSEPNLALVGVGGVGSKWDQSLWDQGLWSGTFSSSTLCGGAGYGREFAVLLEGSTSSRATLTSIEGTYQRWAFL